MPDPVDYATPGTGSRGKLVIARWAASASLLPLPSLVCVVYFRTAWADVLRLGQTSATLSGVLWIVTACWSLAWCVAFSHGRNNILRRICFLCHALFVALTVLPPGCVLLAWLMHWLSGPGA